MRRAIRRFPFSDDGPRAAKVSGVRRPVRLSAGPGLRPGVNPGGVARGSSSRTRLGVPSRSSVVLEGLQRVLRRFGRDSGRQPWRCLWRGFSQITMTTAWRRMTLHLSQIFLTLGLTFMRASRSIVVAALNRG